MANDPHKQPSDQTTISPCNRPVIPDIFISGAPITRDGAGNPVSGSPIFPGSFPLFSPLFGCLWFQSYGPGTGVNYIRIAVNDPVDGNVTIEVGITVSGVQHVTEWQTHDPQWWNSTATANDALTIPQTIVFFNP